MARFGQRTGIQSLVFRSLCFLTASAACSLIVQQAANAQFGGGGGNTIGGGPTSGVAVDADGVLRRVMVNDPTGELARQRAQEAAEQSAGAP